MFSGDEMNATISGLPFVVLPISFTSDAVARLVELGEIIRDLPPVGDRSVGSGLESEDRTRRRHLRECCGNCQQSHAGGKS